MPLDDAVLRALRREIRIRGRTLRWIAVALVLAGPGLCCVLFAMPVLTAQSLGVDREVTAQVLEVQQVHGGRRGPSWDVTVTWLDDGTPRAAHGRIRADLPPAAAGDEMTVHTVAGRDEVSLQSDASARGVALLFPGAGVVLLSVGVVTGVLGPLRRRRLIRLASETTPWTVEVVGTTTRVARYVGSFRGGRGFRVSRKGFSVGYRSPAESALLELDDRPNDFREPKPGQLLQVWRLPGPGDRPCAVLRTTDTTWWLGTAPPPS